MRFDIAKGSGSALVAAWMLAAAPHAALAQEVELDAQPDRVNAVQPVGVADPQPAVSARKPNGAAAAPLTAPPIDDGKWTFGGALRGRITVNFDDLNRRTGQADTGTYFGFDAAILKANYDSSTFFGAAQYNIYGGAYPYNHAAGYKEYIGEMSFLRFAYVGVKLDKENSITAGLQQVPFGLLPYFGTSFIETMSWVIGVEDFFNVGVKYSHVEPDLNYQFGYFPADGGSYFGISRDSARYSANFVRADSYLGGGTNNVEQNLLVGRAEQTVYRDDLMSATFGVSALRSNIYNYDTTLFGSKWQEAVHFLGTYGPWTTRAIVTRVDINPRNPGGRNTLITMGSFDGSYNVATRGWAVSGEIAYKFTPTVGPFSEVVPYLNYSAYYKDRADFKDSERYVLGAALTARDIKGLYIYSEFRFGRNDPYTGVGNYGQGLGAGGTNRWATTYLTNIGYYF